MQESVDTLIASTEHGADTSVVETAEETPQQETAETPAPAPADTREQDESSDGVTIAHKKVIARPDSTEKTDLTELLAREEAKKIVIGNSVPGANTVVQNDTPAAPTEEPVVPPTAPLPGNTFSPTNGTVPPKPNNDETDPNSIAL
jgi:hypothetical protein